MRLGLRRNWERGVVVGCHDSSSMVTAVTAADTCDNATGKSEGRRKTNDEDPEKWSVPAPAKGNERISLT